MCVYSRYTCVPSACVRVHVTQNMHLSCLVYTFTNCAKSILGIHLNVLDVLSVLLALHPKCLSLCVCAFLHLCFCLQIYISQRNIRLSITAPHTISYNASVCI